MRTGKCSILPTMVAAVALTTLGSGIAHAEPAPEPVPVEVSQACDTGYEAPLWGETAFTAAPVPHGLDAGLIPGPENEVADEMAATGPSEDTEPAADPEPTQEPITVDDPIPGSAPSRSLVLVPVSSVHPVTSAAAIDKSMVIYASHPSPRVTDADIDLGLFAAGVNHALLPQFISATRTIMHGESGGWSNSVNRGDSNAWGYAQADGAPANSSRGPMQTIPGTFATYHAPGTSRAIYDPAANIAAAWRYISARYKVDLRTGAGLSAFMARGVGHGVGY